MSSLRCKGDEQSLVNCTHDAGVASEAPEDSLAVVCKQGIWELKVQTYYTILYGKAIVFNFVRIFISEIEWKLDYLEDEHIIYLEENYVYWKT